MAFYSFAWGQKKLKVIPLSAPEQAYSYENATYIPEISLQFADGINSRALAILQGDTNAKRGGLRIFAEIQHDDSVLANLSSSSTVTKSLFFCSNT